VVNVFLIAEKSQSLFEFAYEFECHLMKIFSVKYETYKETPKLALLLAYCNPFTKRCRNARNLRFSLDREK